MSKLSRTETLILRNQLALMRYVTAETESERLSMKMRLNSNVGYTHQFLLSNSDD